MVQEMMNHQPTNFLLYENDSRKEGATESQRFFHLTHYDYRGRNCEINVLFQPTVTTSNETKEKDKKNS